MDCSGHALRLGSRRGNNRSMLLSTTRFEAFRCDGEARGFRLRWKSRPRGGRPNIWADFRRLKRRQPAKRRARPRSPACLAGRKRPGWGWAAPGLSPPPDFPPARSLFRAISKISDLPVAAFCARCPAMTQKRARTRFLRWRAVGKGAIKIARPEASYGLRDSVDANAELYGSDGRLIVLNVHRRDFLLGADSFAARS